MQSSIATTDISLTQDVRKTVLDNGLTVLTKEVHTAPVVSVQVWYRVGSSNERPGINGIAHQLEHMLFRGTHDRPVQFGQLFNALGSESNAYTSYDQTVYFNTAQRDRLRSLLVLEADRMQNARIDELHLAIEKQVVLSELQGYENRPSYRLNRKVMQAALPGQPYSLPVGGTPEDVRQLTVEQVRDYYRRYYTPSNAVLVIVGDFQTERAIGWIEELFGQLPPAEPSPRDRDRQFPLTTAHSRVILREPGSAALLQLMYPLPAVGHPDIPALRVLDFILTQGRNARLQKTLADSGLASEVSSYVANFQKVGWYKLYGTASPGVELSEIEQTIQETIARIQAEGVTTAELKRAKAQLRADALLQNRDITSQGMQLGEDETTAGDYRDRDRLLAAIDRVSVADVRRVASTYLAPARGIVGFFEPTQEAPIQQAEDIDKPALDLRTASTQPPSHPLPPSNVTDYLPPLPPTDRDRPEQPLPERITLKNGLVVLLLPDRSTPTVTLSGHVRAGNEFDPFSLGGLASLTADSLTSGTQTQDALTLAQTLSDRGASLTFDSFRESVAITGESLAADLPLLIETLSDILQNATFPADELALKRQQALAAFQEQLDTPWRLAWRTLQQAVYPENHPFYVFPTAESLRRITREDVQRFKAKHYRPDTTVLTLVGDFELQGARSLLEAQFGTWQVAGEPPILIYPPVPLPERVIYLNPVIPGKAQSITYIGFGGIARDDPRYYVALVLNQILGGDTLSSRLGRKIRDSLGLTYGIYSYFQAGRNPGPFLIEMQTAPQDTEPAIAKTLLLLKQLHDRGVTLTEVEAAKTTLTSRYPVTLANPEALAETILTNEVYGLEPAELRQFSEKIQAVTLEEVNRAAKELLHPDNLVVVTAGQAVWAHR
jgi:zinc protease